MTEKEIIDLADDILQEYTNCYSDEDRDYLVKMLRKKIPEGAVVLTREQAAEIVSNHNQINAEARKETAREFASFVKSKLFDLGNIVNERDIDDMLKVFFNEN